VDVNLGGIRRRSALGGVRVVVAVVATLAALAVVPSAQASVTGQFCSHLSLASGRSCHSPTFHSFFDEVEGYSDHGYPVCVGIDSTTSGPNIINACTNGSAIDCLSACTRSQSGYAYVHNHGSITDYYNGVLSAAA
jgi:hypothetical protein